jgi:hypothetical protein
MDDFGLDSLILRSLHIKEDQQDKTRSRSWSLLVINTSISVSVSVSELKPTYVLRPSSLIFTLIYDDAELKICFVVVSIYFYLSLLRSFKTFAI